ncbi:MAG: hypothetical protein HY731_02500 [Candidatus Tectomicrobia bacterium]|nr:hypothetical protein [Candidatus Tectomicrobia bacterium]
MENFFSVLKKKFSKETLIDVGIGVPDHLQASYVLVQFLYLLPQEMRALALKPHAFMMV